MARETSTADQSLKDSSSYQSPYPKFRGWALITTPFRPSMTASPVTVNDCVSHHAVLIAPGLWLASPKNGNISNVGQRLSTISLPSCANWEYRDGRPIHERPQLAGTSRICRPTIFS